MFKRLLSSSFGAAAAASCRSTQVVRTAPIAVATQRSFSSISSINRVLNLNDLQNLPGTKRRRKRLGRGPGSGLGKLAGHGHQFSQAAHSSFEGGQSPMFKRFRKLGFHNPNKKDFQTVSLEKIQEYIDMGRLTPKPNTLLTMRDLVYSGVVNRAKEGIKVLATGKEKLTTPIHLEVTSASLEAIKAVEAVGGTVTAVHFNRLALRSLLFPTKYDMMPRRAKPNPKDIAFYLDKSRSGYLSPEVQVRNLLLFGHVTSEQSCRREHRALTEVWRERWAEEAARKKNEPPPKPRVPGTPGIGHRWKNPFR